MSLGEFGGVWGFFVLWSFDSQARLLAVSLHDLRVYVLCKTSPKTIEEF